MTTNDHDPTPEEGQQRVDEASGQKVGPPGGGDLKPSKLDDQVEDLEKAGGGH